MPQIFLAVEKKIIVEKYQVRFSFKISMGSIIASADRRKEYPSQIVQVEVRGFDILVRPMSYSVVEKRQPEIDLRCIVEEHILFKQERARAAKDRLSSTADIVNGDCSDCIDILSNFSKEMNCGCRSGALSSCPPNSEICEHINHRHLHLVSNLGDE